MNEIYLKGVIRNIQYSHTIDNVVYHKADMIVKRPDGREDLLIVKFKQFSMNFKEDSVVELVGNIRSYSHKVDGKNSVEIYVFSYFDEVENSESYGSDNVATVVGKICKKDDLRTTINGKHYIHFILVNNMMLENGQRLNSYIPCVAWGKTAKDIDANYNISDTIKIDGQLHSREYKKKISDTEIEIKVAHEFATIEVARID